MSGSLIQSKPTVDENTGRFEVVVPSRTGAGLGLVHYFRLHDNGMPPFPWIGPTRFGGAVSYQGVSLIQSNFGSPGNLEVVAVTSGGQLVHFWREVGPSPIWHGPFPFASGVRGVPGLIQGRFGARGDFEVVVPAVSGGLLHFSRNNDIPELPWVEHKPFAQNLGLFDAVSLIQGNFGVSGNLELAATAAAAPGVPARQVFHFWNTDPSSMWSNPTPILSDVDVPAIGLPALIQGRFGVMGNFELVVNNATGLQHFWRENDRSGLPWHGPNVVAAGFMSDIPSMIQSSFGTLDVIAETSVGVTTDLAYLQRDVTWNGPVIVETGV